MYPTTAKDISVFGRKVALIAFYGAVLVAPLLFLPTTTDFFDFNKRIFLAVTAIVLLALWGILAIAKNTVRVTVSPLLIPVLAYAGTVLASTLIATSYPIEVLWGRGMLIIALTLIFILATTLIHAKTALYVRLLNIAGVVLSIVSLAQATGYGVTRLFNLIPGMNMPNSVLFNLAGSPLICVTFLLPLMLIQWISFSQHPQVTQTEKRRKIFEGVVAVLLTAGVVINTYFMLPGKLATPVLPPFQTSWSIAIDVLKKPKSAFFGFGPESYGEAFTQFRPVAQNMIPDLWTMRFSFGRVEPLHIVTTLGLLGLAAWVFLMISIIRFVFPLRASTWKLSVLLLILIAEQIVLPTNILVLALMYFTLSIFVLVKKAEKDQRISELLLHVFAVRLVAPETVERISTEKTSKIFALIIATVAFVLVGIAGFGVFRVYAGEYYMVRSLFAAQRNDGVQTYEFQRKALAHNPFSDSYHRTFASTNLLIANAVASKPSPTEQDKANIPQLLQQAIREAKLTTTLEPRRTANWEALANIYKQLILVAQGSDQWAIAALVRAIQTNPTDPTERFELGSVYMSTQNYEQAVRLFQQAVDLKPDWANAHYNLANAYKQKGDVTLALDELRIIKNMLPADSADVQKLDQDIAAMEQEIVKSKRAGTTTAPSSSTTKKSTVPEGQIKLPADLGLPQENPPTTVPATPETPAPSATPAPSPTS